VYRRNWGMYRTMDGMYKYAGLGSLFLTPLTSGYKYIARPAASRLGKFLWGGTKYSFKTGINWGAQSLKNIVGHVSHPGAKALLGIGWEAGMLPVALDAMKYPKHIIDFAKDTAGNIIGSTIVPTSF